MISLFKCVDESHADSNLPFIMKQRSTNQILLTFLNSEEGR